MNRYLLHCLLIASLAALSGCAMCAGPFDHNYPAFGGAWQRSDPVNGRVGSIFEPAGDQVVGTGVATAPTEALPGESVWQQDAKPPTDEMPDEPPAPGESVLQR